jgi:hypothetical protein
MHELNSANILTQLKQNYEKPSLPRDRFAGSSLPLQVLPCSMAANNNQDADRSEDVVTLCFRFLEFIGQ